MIEPKIGVGDQVRVSTIVTGFAKGELNIRVDLDFPLIEGSLLTHPHKMIRIGDQVSFNATVMDDHGYAGKGNIMVLIDRTPYESRLDGDSRIVKIENCTKIGPEFVEAM